MKQRKSERLAQSLKDRINEMELKKMFLKHNREELQELRKKLLAGDLTVQKRIEELEFLILRDSEWVETNTKIIEEKAG